MGTGFFIKMKLIRLSIQSQKSVYLMYFLPGYFNSGLFFSIRVSIDYNKQKGYILATFPTKNGPQCNVFSSAKIAIVIHLILQNL